jgi:hypothetical protein
MAVSILPASTLSAVMPCNHVGATATSPASTVFNICAGSTERLRQRIHHELRHQGCGRFCLPGDLRDWNVYHPSRIENPGTSGRSRNTGVTARIAADQRFASLSCRDACTGRLYSVTRSKLVCFFIGFTCRSDNDEGTKKKSPGASSTSAHRIPPVIQKTIANCPLAAISRGALRSHF